MASLPTTCIVCGKRFRMIGNGTQSVAELADSPHVHAKGQEGDERCMDQYLEQQAAEAEAAAEAQLEAARKLVAQARYESEHVSPQAEEASEEEAEAEVDEGPEACGYPVGNGTCVLEKGHAGAHRLTEP